MKNKNISNQQKNVLNYGNWLNTIQWNFYCTLTTPYPLSMASARRIMIKFEKKFVKTYGGVCGFWTSEPFDCKEGWHIHALIKKPELLFGISEKDVKEVWLSVAKTKKVKGEYRTHISKYYPDKGGNLYFSKYIGRPNTDYDFFSSGNI